MEQKIWTPITGVEKGMVTQVRKMRLKKRKNNGKSEMIENILIFPYLYLIGRI